MVASRGGPTLALIRRSDGPAPAIAAGGVVSSQVVPNGIDGVTGEPLLAPIDPKDLARLIGGAQRDARFSKTLVERAHSDEADLGFGDHDPRRLDELGWGVVFPQGIDDSVRQQLKPLLDRREGEAGKRFKVFEDVNPAMSWRDFLTSHRAPRRGVVDPDRVPYYLLLVGSPQQFSWRFQRQLGTPHAVGRVDFATPEEYGRYATAMGGRPNPEIPQQPPLHVIAPRNDGDVATQLSSTRLARSVADALSEEGRATVSSRIGHSADRAAFVDGLNCGDERRFLLTASHGVGYEPGHDLQVGHQGALVTSSWAKGETVDPANDLVTASVVDEVNPEGLIALIVACFGAGTPRYDTFAELGRASNTEPEPLASAPFTAALPQALLSHTSGPASAIVSHVDRAWSSTFVGPLRESQAQTFKSIIKKVLRGCPIGAAMEDMTSVYAQAGAELAEAVFHVDRGRRARAEEVNDRWLETADAGGYVVLGDPAAQLGSGPGAE